MNLISLDKNLQNEILSRITNNFKVKNVILFGSFATGNADKDSDIDLLIILDEAGIAASSDDILHRRLKIAKILHDIRQRISIDTLVYTRDEWDKLLSRNSSFVRDIQKNGIVLV